MAISPSSQPIFQGLGQVAIDANSERGLGLLIRANKAAAKGSVDAATDLYLRALKALFPTSISKAGASIAPIASIPPQIPANQKENVAPPLPTDQPSLAAMRWLLDSSLDPDLSFLAAWSIRLAPDNQRRAVPLIISGWRLLRLLDRADAARQLALATLEIDTKSRRDRLILRQIRQTLGPNASGPEDPVARAVAKQLGAAPTSTHGIEELSGKSRGVRYVRRHILDGRETGRSVSFVEKHLDTASPHSQAEICFYSARLYNGQDHWSVPRTLSVITSSTSTRLFLEDVANVTTAPVAGLVRFSSLTRAAAHFIGDTSHTDPLPIPTRDLDNSLDWLTQTIHRLQDMRDHAFIMDSPPMSRLLDDLSTLQEGSGALRDLNALPLALSHGDLHSDNVMWLGTTPCMIDWGHFGYRPIGLDLAWCFWSSLVKAAPDDVRQMQLDLAEIFIDALAEAGVPAWRSDRRQMMRDVVWIAALGAVRASLERRIARRLFTLAEQQEIIWNDAEMRRIATLSAATRFLIGELQGGTLQRLI